MRKNSHIRFEILLLEMIMIQAIGQNFCDQQTILNLFYSFLMQLAQLDVIFFKNIITFKAFFDKLFFAIICKVESKISAWFLFTLADDSTKWLVKECPKCNDILDVNYIWLG